MGVKRRAGGALAAGLALWLVGCSSSKQQERRDGGAVRDAAARGDAGAGDAADEASDGGAASDGVGGGDGVDGSAASDLTDADAADAADATPDGAFGYRVDAAAAKAGGTVKVIVRWPDTPQVRRASPGENECGKPRAPSVVPDELWGVAEAFVLLDVARGKARGAARPIAIAAERCALLPRVALARPGGRLSLRSRDGAVHVAKVRAHAWPGSGEADDGKAGASLVRLAAGAAKPRPLRLPWRGHRVELALPEPALWQLELEGKHAAEDAAWLVVPPHPYAAITDRAGGVSFTEVPAGEVAVRAFIPARGGGKALELQGKVTVPAGGSAELILTPTASSPSSSKPAPAGRDDEGEPDSQ